MRGNCEQAHRLLGVSECGHGEAHEVQGVAIEGFAGEYVATQGHRFHQASLAVERARLRERGSAADHGFEDRVRRLRRYEQLTITPLPAASGSARPGRPAPPSAA